MWDKTTIGTIGFLGNSGQHLTSIGVSWGKKDLKEHSETQSHKGMKESAKNSH